MDSLRRAGSSLVTRNERRPVTPKVTPEAEVCQVCQNQIVKLNPNYLDYWPLGG